MKSISLLLVSLILVSFIGITKDSAKIKVTVIDEDNLIVEGAKVSIYPTYESFKIEKNWVASGVTNKKGYVEFKGLKEMIYYIHVKKGELNNNLGDNKTDTLSIASKNRFEIMID